MWTLVFIYLYAGDPYAVKYGSYNSMYDCFYTREDLSKEVGKGSGYFNPGQQAVCIYEEKKEL